VRKVLSDEIQHESRIKKDEKVACQTSKKQNVSHAPSTLLLVNTHSYLIGPMPYELAL